MYFNLSGFFMIKFVSDIVELSSTANLFYMCFDKSFLDFTDEDSKPTIKISSLSGSFSVEIETSKLPLLVEVLRETIFSKENKIISWNWKDFISYLTYHFGKLVEFKALILDLKILESFFFIKLEKPETYSEAIDRFKKVKSDSEWNKLHHVYKEIYTPLLTLVVPSMEVVPLLDYEAKSKVYAYYEINGQDNGRMLCSNVRVHGYNPHTLSKEQKSKYKPCVPFNVFLGFDFKSMEVAVLAHLANDDKLSELIQSKDIYTSIFQAITDSNVVDQNSRNIAKKIFLPTIYGMSAKTLAVQANIEVSFAEQICKNITQKFSKSVKYVKDFVSLAESQGTISDYFGKRRNFSENFYKARNFSIQSPASLICLEKLVELWKITHDKTRICYHVHDGYYVYATNDNWKEIAMDVKRVLISESKICPGLKLRVTCQIGTSLQNMKSLEKR